MVKAGCILNCIKLYLLCDLMLFGTHNIYNIVWAFLGGRGAIMKRKENLWDRKSTETEIEWENGKYHSMYFNFNSHNPKFHHTFVKHWFKIVLENIIQQQLKTETSHNITFKTLTRVVWLLTKKIFLHLDWF